MEGRQWEELGGEKEKRKTISLYFHQKNFLKEKCISKTNRVATEFLCKLLYCNWLGHQRRIIIVTKITV